MQKFRPHFKDELLDSILKYLENMFRKKVLEINQMHQFDL